MPVQSAELPYYAVMDINLNALYFLSQLAAKEMVKQGSGKIINISSMLTFQGGKFVSAYPASKHGLAGLTKAFANELTGHTIQINAIAPGYIETANTAALRADESKKKKSFQEFPLKNEELLSCRASDYVLHLITYP